MAAWPKHEIVDLAELTLQAFDQAVAAISEITGLSSAEVRGKLLEIIETKRPWEIRLWKPLADKVKEAQDAGP